MLLAGTLLTAVPDRDQYIGFAHRGALYATWIRDAPSPYLSKLQRFDPRVNGWQDVFVDDARFNYSRPDAGRLPLIEYRESGGGASNNIFSVLDLASGQTTKIDAFALSPATFHGGGGGPRGPRITFVLAGDRVAWSRINELPGGVTEGELRLAPLGDPAHFTTIGRSRASIEALWLDDATLGYLVGGSDQDEIRVRDLATGAERVLTRVVAPGQDRGIGGMARSDRFLGWIENLPASASTPGGLMRSVFHAIDVASGSARELDLGATTCVSLAGNSLGFTWWCWDTGPTATSLAYFDPRTWRSVEIVRSGDRLNDPSAFDGGFMWFDLVAGVRRVNALIVR